MRFLVAIPVLNPGPAAQELAASIGRQTMRPAEVLVLDSESTDGWVEPFARAGARVQKVARREFDHGGTRNLGLAAAGAADAIVFLTQDALPAADDAFERLLAPLQDPRVAAVCGRQLPRPGARGYECHARLFNYPARSDVRGAEDIPRLGVKAAFISNSFAAYRVSALREIGGFPERTIFGEDTIAVAELLRRGWKLAYAADAAVYHSHDYTVGQEFRRYFDVGVFHARERGYVELLGGPSGEGLRFVRSEIAALRSEQVPLATLRVVARNGVRWIGYRLGRVHRSIPNPVRRRISMNKGFWRG